MKFFLFKFEFSTNNVVVICENLFHYFSDVFMREIFNLKNAKDFELFNNIGNRLFIAQKLRKEILFFLLKLLELFKVVKDN